MHQWDQSLPKTQRSFGAKEFQSWTKFSFSDQFFAKNTKELGRGEFQNTTNNNFLTKSLAKRPDQVFCPKCIAQWTKMFMCVCLSVCGRYQINGYFCAILSSFWILKSPFFVCETFKIRKREPQVGDFEVLGIRSFQDPYKCAFRYRYKMENWNDRKIWKVVHSASSEIIFAKIIENLKLHKINFRMIWSCCSSERVNLNRLPNGLTSVHCRKVEILHVGTSFFRTCTV